MQNHMNIEILDLSAEEFKSISKTSFDSYIRDLVEATGKNEAELRRTMNPPSNPTKDDIWRKIELNGTRIGFLWVKIEKEGNAFGYDIHIDEKFRDQGVGRKVMLGMKEHLRSLGVRKVRIAALKDNHRARHLYKSLGFRELGYDEKWKSYRMAIDLSENCLH